MTSRFPRRISARDGEPLLHGSIGASAAFYISQYWNATFIPSLPGVAKEELSEFLDKSEYPELFDFYTVTGGTEVEGSLSIDLDGRTYTSPERVRSGENRVGSALLFVDQLLGIYWVGMVPESERYRGHNIVLIPDLEESRAERIFIARNLLDFVIMQIMRSPQVHDSHEAREYHRSLALKTDSP